MLRLAPAALLAAMLSLVLAPAINGAGEVLPDLDIPNHQDCLRTQPALIQHTCFAATPPSADSLLPEEAFELAGVTASDAQAPPVEDDPRSLRRIASRDGVASLRGVATWYGGSFHGQTMRGGEIFDMHDPATLAANAFPIGSWLRVTNIANGAIIEARVTDTGAFRYPIVVDLSWAAFRELADPNVGVIAVSVQPLHRE